MFAMIVKHHGRYTVVYEDVYKRSMSVDTNAGTVETRAKSTRETIAGLLQLDCVAYKTVKQAAERLGLDKYQAKNCRHQGRLYFG